MCTFGTKAYKVNETKRMHQSVLKLKLDAKTSYEPFSSAMYVTVMGVPSGDVYEYEPSK